MKIKKRLALAFVAIWAFGMSSTACALPVLDTKDAAVRINTSGQVMNIGSSAVNNVVQWVDFSIAGGETVTFDKNNYLNYVTGHAASEIFGTLTGGGNIFIINPHGILIGHDANVNVGNLYLSTQALSDAQLDAFGACGTSPILDASNANGNVVNLGHLEAKTVVVEGNVIKFKNVADVKATQNVDVHAKGEIHIGFGVGDEIKAVNETEYKNVQAPSHPTHWHFAGKEPVWYMLVRNEFELQNMKNNLQGNYMLARDIKANDFQTVGSGSNSYKGHFDGLGHEIELVNVRANGYTSGLFGAIKSGSVVENVSVRTGAIEDPGLNSNNTGYIGGVAGWNYEGAIRNVCHYGSISVKEKSQYYMGGIVGFNEGGIINRVCNNGEISVPEGSTAYVGGIVGYNYTDGIVDTAFNKGSIHNGFFSGGIAGGNRNGSITNVYNLAPVSGQWAGGVVGKAFDNAANISYAYHALGEITGLAKAGAIVGGIEGNKCTTTHVFHVNANVHVKAYNGTVTEVAELKKKGENWWQKSETFEKDGWSLSPKGGENTTWRICDGYSMPLLTAFLKPKYNSSIVEYDGTRPAGTYRSEPSFSTQLEGFQQGCDYISDLTWVLPKDEPTGTKPIDTNHAADNPKPFEPSKPFKPDKPFKPGKSIGSDKVETEDSIGKEYDNEIAALRHLETEEQESAGAAMESETDKLIVVGSVVRLPDAMSAEDLEAMLSKAEI